MTTITINPDLTVRIESDTHLCVLPAYHPETLAPWASEDDARAYAESIQGDSRFMMLKPAPVPNRTKVNRTEYYGLFTALEEAMIRIAASEEVTLAKLGAANTAEKQRLMTVAALQVMLRRADAILPTDNLELAHPQVQEGLGLLVAMGLLTSARKTEIEAGVLA